MIRDGGADIDLPQLRPDDPPSTISLIVHVLSHVASLEAAAFAGAVAADGGRTTVSSLVESFFWSSS